MLVIRIKGVKVVVLLNHLILMRANFGKTKKTKHEGFCFAFVSESKTGETVSSSVVVTEIHSNKSAQKHFSSQRNTDMLAL